MPATYAHCRFGREVLASAPADVRQCVQRFRRLYDAGLHGPDLFFYHNPFFATAAGQLGETYHRQTGQEFFTRACAQADSEGAKAYLYGVLAHYALDSACHPFVNKMVAEGKAGHTKLESEFERYLLEADHLLPAHVFDQAKHIRLTRGECVTAAGFYPPADPWDVFWAVRFMAFSIRFLNQKNRDKAVAVLTRLKRKLLDSLIPLELDKSWVRMDSELLARYNRAVRDYPRMLEQLKAHMETGEPLGEDFAPTFN